MRSLLTAVRVEPGSQSAYNALADLYISNGQYEEAAAPIRKALQIESGVGRTGIAFIGALLLDGLLALRKGEMERSREQLDRAVEKLCRIEPPVCAGLSGADSSRTR